MSEPIYFSGADAGASKDEALRLEAVTTCVGFDDLLDVTVTLNHPHLDTAIVVTSHEDKKTQAVAAKHGAFCVPTDLFQKNQRNFNKGAAINAGFNYFQYNGWRLHLDSDIALPDNFRRVLFNHTNLETDCLYGADRIDVVGEEISLLKSLAAEFPQHRLRFLVDPTHDRQLTGSLGGRLASNLTGYMPLGFFQLWNYRQQKGYPYSKGTAAHDDTMFSCLWPVAKRRLLPTAFVYHLCAAAPKWGENWDGKRRQPRLGGKAEMGRQGTVARRSTATTDGRRPSTDGAADALEKGEATEGARS